MKEMGDKAVLSRDVPPSDGEAVSGDDVGMDDLTITRLCAEAMGYQTKFPTGDGVFTFRDLGLFKNDKLVIHGYDPLHDDAQAMALVKKFGLCLDHFYDYAPKAWLVVEPQTETGAQDDNLNRAIVECVAKIPMQEKPHEPS